MRYALSSVLLIASLLLPFRSDAQAAAPSLQQTQNVVARYLSAYDARDMRLALSLVSATIRYADCDYARGRAVVVQGKPALNRWLRKQFRLHDQFVISEIQPGGWVGDDYSPRVFGFDGTRTNSAIQAFGLPSVVLSFPKGIMNAAGTKIDGVTIAGAGCTLSHERAVLHDSVRTL